MMPVHGTGRTWYPECRRCGWVGMLLVCQPAAEAALVEHYQTTHDGGTLEDATG